jgi:hypothetical protein
MKIRFLIVAMACWFSAGARAQWLTQRLDLKTGWNAVYLHVDCTHTNIAGLTDISGPIDEIWMWVPSQTTAQFVDNPQAPIGSGSQWVTWKRGNVSNPLERLIGNTAYLVLSSANFQWNVKGKPIAPSAQWTITGLNFIGFPTAPSVPPTFFKFFEQQTDVRQELKVYEYFTGDVNPAELESFLFPTEPLKRGQAYWMRAGQNYFHGYGPLEVSAPGGINFGDTTAQRSLRLRNYSLKTNTVTLSLLASETPPAGQSPIVGIPPVLVRGDINKTNLTYGYSTLSAGTAMTWTLAPSGQPGSEIEVILGINRYAMTGAPGSFYAAVARLKDSFGYTQIDLPLSATMSSTAGLWVGNASVTSVNSYLKTYAQNTSGERTLNADGSYSVASLVTNTGPVARPFPLRLIVHHDGTNSMLLQRVFHGFNTATNPIITLNQSRLDPAQLVSARRISAPHLPWTSGNSGWRCAGDFRQGGTLTATVSLDYADQASNPFLHTYHPDHDNMDARFQNVLAQGVESYGVTRKITLSIQPPAQNFASLTASGATLSGVYAEEITVAGQGAKTRTFNSSGQFSLNRISTISAITP